MPGKKALNVRLYLVPNGSEAFRVIYYSLPLSTECTTPT
jgi:hypothetical protein